MLILASVPDGFYRPGTWHSILKDNSLRMRSAGFF